MITSIYLAKFPLEKEGGLYQNKVDLSLTFTQRLGHQAHNCKMTYSRSWSKVNKQRRSFISLSELGYGPLEFNFRRVRLHLTSKFVGIIALRTERTQIHVLGDVLVVVVSLDLKPRANGRNIVGQQLPKMLGVVASVYTYLKVWPVSNLVQQHPTTCNRVCKRTEHVTCNNVGSCWQTIVRPFALDFKPP